MWFFFHYAQNVVFLLGKRKRNYKHLIASWDDVGVNSAGVKPLATYWTTTYPWYLLFTFNVALEIASPASFVATHCTVPLSPDCRLVNLSSFLLFIWIRPTFDGVTFCPLWNQVIWGFGEPVALHSNTTDSWGYLSAMAGWTMKVGFSKEQGNYIATVKSKAVTLIANISTPICIQYSTTTRNSPVHNRGSVYDMCNKNFTRLLPKIFRLCKIITFFIVFTFFPLPLTRQKTLTKHLHAPQWHKHLYTYQQGSMSLTETGEKQYLLLRSSIVTVKRASLPISPSLVKDRSHLLIQLEGIIC